jgi:DNA-binding NarL/FixJ family response regulator
MMEVKMQSPRVLLADDLPEMLETVTQLLRDDFEIVGYAQGGEDAIKAATTYNPDLLVLDTEMPFRNGIQVVSYLRDSGCRAKVIFLTVHEDLDYVEAAWSDEAPKEYGLDEAVNRRYSCTVGYRSLQVMMERMNS